MGGEGSKIQRIWLQGHVGGSDGEQAHFRYAKNTLSQSRCRFDEGLEGWRTTGFRGTLDLVSV